MLQVVPEVSTLMFDEDGDGAPIGSLADLRYRASSFLPESSSLKESKSGLTTNALHFLALVGLCIVLVIAGIAILVLVVRRWFTWKQLIGIIIELAVLLIGAVSLVLAKQTRTNCGRMYRRFTLQEATKAFALQNSKEGVTVSKVHRPDLRRLQDARLVSVNHVAVYITNDLHATTTKCTWEFDSPHQVELDRLAVTYYLRIGYVSLAMAVVFPAVTIMLRRV